MKKGLNVTLMTVAIAVMALQAMAIAPVIDPIPSPIVGSDSNLPVSQATPFVFPDAFDLDTKVADETTADADILWSYTYTGTDTYKINNVGKIIVGTDNIDAPGAKRLNGSTTDPGDVDTLSKTITIRNIKYRPIGGPNTDPGYTGIGDSQVITFFASDGTTHNLGRQVIFYTDAGGNDRFTGTPTGTPIPTAYPTVHPPVSQLDNFDGVMLGTVTSSTEGGTAVCLQTSLSGLNYGMWNSDWGIIPLTANTVYRIRAKVSGTQVAGQAPTTPFWDMIIGNYQDVTHGLNLYGGDHMFLDNEGPFVGGVPTPGANACLTTPAEGKTFTWVWCPAPIVTAAWNDPTTGIFATSVSATMRNAQFHFRVLDLGTTSGNAGITADWDAGKLCLKDLVIESIPYSSLQFTQVQNVTSFSATNLQVIGAIGGTTAERTFTSGACTVKPTSAAEEFEYTSIYPGDQVLSGTTPQTAYPILFPIPWESNTLYQVIWKLDAPTSNDESHPWDVLYISADTATNELIEYSFVTPNQNRCGMPKVGAAQTFMSFLYSHNETVSSVANFHRIRPRMELANAGDGINFGTVSNGAVRITGWTVNKVTIP